MARKTDIRLRRSATAGNKPSTSDLNLGELALNTYDGAVFLKTHDGSSDAIAVAADARTLSIDYDNKRVGIGTTTPSYKLNVQTAASDANNDWPALFKSFDDKAGIVIADNDTSNYIISQNSFLSLGSNAAIAANNLNIKSTGEVGIGTTSPSELLHISGSGATISGKVEATDGNQASLDLKNNEGEFRLICDGGELSIFDQTDATERFRIDTSGNVGIGTNNPTEPLSIHASDPKIKLQDTDGTLQVGTITMAGGLMNIQARDNTSHGIIKFQGYNGTTGLEYARFNASGNFGIGTGSPGGGKLVVHTVSGEYGLRLQDNSSHYFRVAHGGATEIAGDVTINAGLRVNHNPLLLDTNPASTYGVSEALRIDDGAGTTDRQLQIFELQHSGARSHRLTFNTNITTDGSAYTYTQGNYGGSSQIEFANNGGLVFYTVNQISGGSTTSITPIERFRINDDGDIRFESGNLFYDASANALNFIDNVYAQFGSSNDLQIYHDGNYSYIRDVGTGDLRIAGASNVQIWNSDIDSQMANFANGGAATLYYAGAAKLATTSGGVNITGDITNTSGNLSLDVAGDIILDAGGANINFNDDGTAVGHIEMAGSNLEIKSKVADKDIIFKGNDNGSTVTALTLDMSSEGDAIFGNDIFLGDGNPVRFGTDQDFRIWFDGSHANIQNTTSNSDIIIKGNDGSSTITALTLDMSEAGRATFNSDVIVGGNLTVNGTSTTINTATLDVEDLNITVAKGAGSSSAASGGGLTIDGAGASLIWDHGNQYLELNKDLFTPGSFIIGTTSTNVGRMYNSSGVMALEAYTSRQISFGNATSGEFVRIDESGRVGIGTTDPNANLHIGSSVSMGSQSNPAIQVGSTNNYRFGVYTGNEDAIIENKNGDDGIAFRVKTAGEAMRIDGGTGNVGIGTTAPSTKLHISNNAAPADDLTLLTLQNGNSTGDISTPNTFIDFEFKDSNENTTPQARIGAHAGDGSDANTTTLEGKGYLTFHTSNTTGTSAAAPPERMRLLADGQLLLGLTSSDVGFSTNAFELAGNIRMRGGNHGIKSNNGSVEIHLARLASSNNVFLGNDKIMVANSGGAITFNSAYTFPTSDGSSGHVLKTDGSGNLSFGTVSAGAATSLEDADSDTKIQVEESSDEDVIRMDTGGTERVQVTSNGINIVNSGGYRISGTEVISSARNATFASTVTIGSGNEAITLGKFNSGQSDITGLVGGSTFGSLITGGNNGHVVVKLKDNDVGDSFSVVSGGGNFMTDSTSDTLALRVKATGETHIGGTLTTSSTIKVDPPSGDAIVQMEGASGAQILRIDQNSIRTSTSSDLSIFTSGNTRQIFLDQSSGNTGFNMGSDIPHAGTAVHIKGDSTNPDFTATAIDDITLVLSNSDDDYGTIFGQLGTGTGVIQPRRLASAVYYNLALNPHGGNVGVGTVSPSEPLHVSKASGGEAKIRIDSLDIARNNFIGITGHDNLVLAADEGNEGADSSIRMNVDGTERVRIDAFGRVGIGTDSPSSKLHISNNAAPTDDLTLLTLQNGNSTGDIATPNTFIDFQFKDSNANVVPQARIGAHAGDGGNADSQVKEGKGYLTFHTSDTTNESGTEAPPERVRISHDGKVGIGTNAPDGNVHIKSLNNVGDATLIVEADADNNVEADNPRIELRQDGNNVAGYLYIEGEAGQTATGTLANNTVLESKATVNGQGIHFATGGRAPAQSGGALNGSVRMTILGDGNVGIGTSSPDTRLDVTAAGVEGLIMNQDTGNAAVSARMFFKDNVRTNGFLNVNGVLEARTGMTIGSSSGTKIVGIGPTQVEITRPLFIEEYQIDTAEVSTSSTTQTVIAQSSATQFRSCRYTVQITNSTDSAYHTTELLLVHDGTTANITEFGTIFTGAALEATFDADIVSGNIRLLATPASGDTMVFKTIKHSITV